MVVGGMYFNPIFFKAYLGGEFGEAFSHTSLSVEKVFTESNQALDQLQKFMSSENTKESTEMSREIYEDRMTKIRQYLTIKCGVPEEAFINPETGIKGLCITDFEPYFLGACKNDLRELIAKCIELFNLLTTKEKADKEAVMLKYANQKAVMYAYENIKRMITVGDIIKLNEIVNEGTSIHTGFKSVDNEIKNCPFVPVPKEQVPTKMQELLYKYEHEWADEIPPMPENSTLDTIGKEMHLKAICEREAKFHIEFEHIHPFEDGNGRTGRIILNNNLINNHMAPVLITEVMRSDYLEAIDNYDYKSLGKTLFLLSSNTLSLMIAKYRKTKGIPNEDLGAINQQVDNLLQKELKKADEINEKKLR